MLRKNVKRIYYVCETLVRNQYVVKTVVLTTIFDMFVDVAVFSTVSRNVRVCNCGWCESACTADPPVRAGIYMRMHATTGAPVTAE